LPPLLIHARDCSLCLLPPSLLLSLIYSPSRGAAEG
jgi:hypothetical protein